MKLPMFLGRQKADRRAARPQRLEDVADRWTAREWADLPAHHPRQG